MNILSSLEQKDLSLKLRLSFPDHILYIALLWNKLYTGKCIYWIAFDARSVCAFITTCTDVEADLSNFCHFNVSYSPLKVLSY